MIIQYQDDTKGWPLDVVFNYTRTAGTYPTVWTVSARKNIRRRLGYKN